MAYTSRGVRTVSVSRTSTPVASTPVTLCWCHHVLPWIVPCFLSASPWSRSRTSSFPSSPNDFCVSAASPVRTYRERQGKGRGRQKGTEGKGRERGLGSESTSSRYSQH